MWIAVALAAVGAACAPTDDGGGSPALERLTHGRELPRPDRVVLLLVAGLDRVDETTPVLSRLADAGGLFPDVVAPSPDADVAAVSALTSSWPRDHGVGIHRDDPPAGITTAGTLFRRAGYATVAVACPAFAVDLEAAGFDLAGAPETAAAPATDPLDRLAGAVEGTTDGPVLALGLLSASCPGVVEAGEAPSPGAVDASIGELLDRIGARDEDILTVVAGLPSFAGDRASLHGPVLHVAVVVHRPGLPAAPASTRTHSLVDLLPTLADLAGLELGAAAGQSLVPILADARSPASLGFRRRPAYAEAWRPENDAAEARLLAAAMVYEGWKLVRTYRSRDGDRGLELYDHVSDPDNADDLMGRHPTLVTRLLARMEQWQEGGPPRSRGS